MDDNVIKFRKPSPPRQRDPRLRKILVVVGALVLFAAVWLYFAFVGAPMAS
ncbi:hypothetical protein AM571_PC01543 (plasmid) [Rhizobium etli 8C-3]|uniref:Uncharacterized protein n=1 Tax=Rhizobium etli 8C-3 TaxID=538025 RepID=A0A1L5PGR7_RHIET|nr:hypothetical protein AM571_PC01543 [Rhizobium etli 8C-3]